MKNLVDRRGGIGRNLIFGARLALMLAQTWRAAAQINVDAFRVTLRATCQSVSGNGGSLAAKTVTETNIIAAVLGLTNGPLDPAVLGQFALVYNTTADRLEVINLSSGGVTRPVVEFGGLASINNGRERARLGFMFVPEEATAIGSALLLEHAVPAGSAGLSSHADIVGRLQFVLTGNSVLEQASLLGQTMAAAGTNSVGFTTNPAVPFFLTNSPGTGPTPGLMGSFSMTGVYDIAGAQICSGFFVTGARVSEAPVPVNLTQSFLPASGQPPNALVDTTNRIGAPGGLNAALFEATTFISPPPPPPPVAPVNALVDTTNRIGAPGGINAALMGNEP